MKLRYFGIIALFILILAACGNNNDDRFTPPPLTREQFLEDFDYLMDTLEANFPYLDIIYRRNGVDMRELAEEIRERIMDEDFNIDYMPFWNMLRGGFFYHAWPVGHLWLVGYPEYRRQIEFIDDFFSPFDMSVIHYFGRRLEDPPQFARRVNPLSTSIIEEGRIAYIRVQSLMDLRPDEQRINNFYSQLGGFEHLIIDIRGNIGGGPQQFHTFIAAPLIDGYLQTQFHHFFMDGYYSYNFHRGLEGELGGVNRIFDFNIEDIGSILPDAELSPEVIEDLALMDFYYIETILVSRGVARRAPFDGKIWILVDEHIISAAMQVAAFYKDVGFATFVGEAGGGMPASNFGSVFFSLPNTTFIVRFDPNYFLDNTGRPLEYGFVPHYPNREGMDALQTVIAMIEEGQWTLR